MSAVVTCSSCQMGDHEHHTEWVTKPLPGVLGGAMCICPGGCVDTVSARWAETFGSVAFDQDGAPVVFCANHPDEPATAEDLFETPLCDGCSRGLDARDEAAASWDYA